MSKPDDIEERVRTIFANHLGVEPAEVTKNKTIMGDLGADSLDAVELVMLVEEEFDIEVSDEEIDTTLTVARLINVVGEKFAPMKVTP